MTKHLFKGIRADNGYDWVEGGILHTKDGVLIVQLDDSGKLSAYDVIPETVCQCSEFYDYGKIKIFEDDIVNYDKERWYIKLGLFFYECTCENGDNMYGWHLVSTDNKKTMPICHVNAPWMFVVGNIHDTHTTRRNASHVLQK